MTLTALSELKRVLGQHYPEDLLDHKARAAEQLYAPLLRAGERSSAASTSRTLEQALAQLSAIQLTLSRFQSAVLSNQRAPEQQQQQQTERLLSHLRQAAQHESAVQHARSLAHDVSPTSSPAGESVHVKSGGTFETLQGIARSLELDTFVDDTTSADERTLSIGASLLVIDITVSSSSLSGSSKVTRVHTTVSTTEEDEASLDAPWIDRRALSWLQRATEATMHQNGDAASGRVRAQRAFALFKSLLRELKRLDAMASANRRTPALASIARFDDALALVLDAELAEASKMDALTRGHGLLSHEIGTSAKTAVLFDVPPAIACAPSFRAAALSTSSSAGVTLEDYLAVAPVQASSVQLELIREEGGGGEQPYVTMDTDVVMETSSESEDGGPSFPLLSKQTPRFRTPASKPDVFLATFARPLVLGAEAMDAVVRVLHPFWETRPSGSSVNEPHLTSFDDLLLSGAPPRGSFAAAAEDGSPAFEFRYTRQTNQSNAGFSLTSLEIISPRQLLRVVEIARAHEKMNALVRSAFPRRNEKRRGQGQNNYPSAGASANGKAMLEERVQAILKQQERRKPEAALARLTADCARFPLPHSLGLSH